MKSTNLPLSANLSEILVNCSIDAIIATDGQGKVLAWNPAAEKLFGIKKERAVGRMFIELIPGIAEDDLMTESFEKAKQGGKAFASANALFAHRAEIETHFLPFAACGAEEPGVVIIAHDVSHYLAAEQQLDELNSQLEIRNIQLEKTAAELTSFNIISSNNVREPIRKIYTDLEYLIRKESNNLSNSGKATFRRIQSTLNRMNLLLQDMHMLSEIRIMQAPRVKADLNHAIDVALLRLRTRIAEADIKIDVGELPELPAHSEHLETLFYHLIDNAIKFSAGNMIPIRVYCSPADVLKDGQPYYRVTVEDGGIGIDGSNHQKIFKIFEKLHEGKFRGSGIGLTVASKIMDAHRGHIQVESVIGDGTKMHCWFPMPMREAVKEQSGSFAAHVN